MVNLLNLPIPKLIIKILIMNNADLVINKMIRLFEDCQNDFGLEDGICLETQCYFEDKFLLLICEYKGHDIGPDQCGILEHDYCYRCGLMKSSIESGHIKS